MCYKSATCDLSSGTRMTFVDFVPLFRPAKTGTRLTFVDYMPEKNASIAQMDQLQDRYLVYYEQFARCQNVDYVP